MIIMKPHGDESSLTMMIITIIATFSAYCRVTPHGTGDALMSDRQTADWWSVHANRCVTRRARHDHTRAVAPASVSTLIISRERQQHARSCRSVNHQAIVFSASDRRPRVLKSLVAHPTDWWNNTAHGGDVVCKHYRSAVIKPFSVPGTAHVHWSPLTC